MHNRIYTKQLITAVTLTFIITLTVVLHMPEKEISVGGVEITSDEKRTGVVADQDAYFLLNGKYDQQAEEVTKDGSIKVDEYVGTKGAGYTITYYKDVTDDGRWRKIENFGAETGRASDWIRIEKPDDTSVATTTR